MGILKREKRVGFWGNLTAVISLSIVFGVVGVTALIGVVACQQKARVRTTVPTSKEGIEVAERTTAPVLTNRLCVLCHPVQPKTVEARGGLHKTAVGCLDCHVEHPPQGTEAVPECNMCHSGAAHYELEECSSCHSDAHAPLDLKLQGAITEPCLTCHQQQGEEVTKYPSMHTDLPCNECHLSHGEIPNCMDCHVRHTEDMEFEACVSCHPVHMPLVITYADDTPSHYCGACHEEALDLLEANTTKHHDLACAFCHKNKHKTIPPCYACHPDPHPRAILDKYPECGQCHGIAHDLKG